MEDGIFPPDTPAPPPTPDNAAAKPNEKLFQIPEKAGRHLGLLIDGNGYKADQVRLARHDTEVHIVPGRTVFTLKPDIATRLVNGTQNHGQVLDSKASVVAAAETQSAAYAADIDIQKQLVAEISKKKGDGFGAPPARFALTGAHKEYAVVEKCHLCAGSTHIDCRTCNAGGKAPCTGCSGQGMTQCTACYGSGQTQKSDGSRPPCTRCNGQGRSVCMTCNGNRLLPCAVCSGQGRIQCAECAHTGYKTQLFDVKWQVDTRFELDETVSPEVREVIDLIGLGNIAPEEQADIHRQEGLVEQGKFIVPYLAHLPIAQVEFSIEGKFYPAVVAGASARIIEIDPLLDRAIKPGINALYKLAQGSIATVSLMQIACRFKILRQIMAGLSHHGKKAVYQKTIREYPLVLSDKYARAAVKYTATALSSLSDGPRWRGLVTGTVVSALLSAGYFLSPARAWVMAQMAAQGFARHAFLPDVLLWLAGIGIAVFCIRKSAANALKTLLPQSVQTDEKGLPSAGPQGWWSVVSTFVPWLAAACFARPVPEWILPLVQKIGLG